MWAIEGCEGIGRHVAQRLLAAGEPVVDVPAKLSARMRMFATGQGVALAAVDRLEHKLAGYHAYHATRADLLRRLGRSQQSRAALDKAIELPIDPAKVLRRNPRLADAQKLVASDGVSRDGAPWRVRGTSPPNYTVSEDLTCTCRWEGRHHGRRGPCKHILAVLLDREAAADAASPSSLSSTPSLDQ